MVIGTATDPYQPAERRFRVTRGVLEVRCHEAPFVLEHGQTVGRLVYERMSARPQRLYGEGMVRRQYEAIVLADETTGLLM